MKNSILALVILSFLISSCSNTRETASGQKFTILKKGDGKEVPSKSFIVMDFVFKDGKDSVWSDTRKNPYPMIIQKNQVNRPGDRVMDVINMLFKGDSAVFQVNSKDLFTNSFRQPLPKNIDSASYFSFYIGVKEVLDSAQFMKYREDLVAKQNEKAIKDQKEQLGKDTVTIDNYLKEKNIVAKKTASGLRYVITKSGKGENAKPSQTAKVSYSGHVLNGKYFDTNIESVAKRENLYQQGMKYEPYGVMVAQGTVIKGWDEMLQLMNKGCQANVYIPSSLGYGSQQRGPVILPNSILVFDMEVVDIK